MRIFFKKTLRGFVYLSMGMLLALLGLLLYGPSLDVLDFEITPVLSSPPLQEVVVRRVIDGDTIELTNGVMVRYIGVDTPELRRRVNGQWTYRPQRLAEEARAYNQFLVEGQPVRLEYDQEQTDRYQRRLAYVFVGDLFVNAELIRTGYARVSLREPNLKYSAYFLRLQREAKDRQRGIWSPGRMSIKNHLASVAR